MVYRIDFDDRQRHVLSQLNLLLNRGLVGKAEIGLSDNALQVVAEIDHHPAILEPDHLPVQLHADLILLTDLEPWIFLRLLQTQRNPLVVGIDIENHDLDLIGLRHDLRRMLHPFRPRHVRDMNQPVDTRLDFHERTKRSQVSHLARDPRPNGILHRQHHPGILLGLFHTEGDLLFLRIHFEHNGLDGFTNRDDGRRMTYRPRPTHLADVNQAFDTGLQFDKCAVVCDADDFALQPRTHRVLLGDVLPRILLQLLHTERNSLALPIDIEDLHLDVLADIYNLRRVRDAAVTHVGNVEQSVHATKVDERTKVGDVLHHTSADLTHLQLLHELIALGRTLGLEDHTTRHHDVATTFVELDDLEFITLAKQLVDIGHSTQGDLAPRQERIDTHQVDYDTTFDLLDQRALHRFVALVCRADLLPHAHEIGFLLRQDDGAILVL